MRKEGIGTLIRRMLNYLWPRRQAAPDAYTPPPIRESTLEELLAAAKVSSNVSVHDRSGRRTKTDDFEIRPTAPQQVDRWIHAVMRASVRIETTWYGFHWYIRPGQQTVPPKLRYVVTGPNRDSRSDGKFELTPDFSWVFDERPINPLLVKHVMRVWVASDAVRAGIAAEEVRLGVAGWKRKPSAQH